MDKFTTKLSPKEKTQYLNNLFAKDKEQYDARKKEIQCSLITNTDTDHRHSFLNEQQTPLESKPKEQLPIQPIFKANASLSSFKKQPAAVGKRKFANMAINTTSSFNTKKQKVQAQMPKLSSFSKANPTKSKASQFACSNVMKQVPIPNAINTTNPKALWASNLAPPALNAEPKKVSSLSDSEKSLKLSTEQERIITAVCKRRKNIFFSGSAGTGKSFLLKVLVDNLRKIYGSYGVFVTASTGIAACNIGGTTLHSFSAVGLARDDQETLAARVARYPQAVARWQDAKALIIDEISMISGDFFTKIEYVARKVRESEKPFGGIQLILCGDFFQLPPVSNGEFEFAFDTQAWHNTVQESYLLTTIFRQAKDVRYQKILNEARVGKLSSESISALNNRVLAFIDESQGIEATKLYAHKHDVETENEKKLARLRGEAYTYHATDTGIARQLTSCPAQETIVLKRNAQVMLLKNLSCEEGLVNGARGVVVDFARIEEDNQYYPLVKFATGKIKHITPEFWSIDVGGETSERIQIPLTLGWAITIHKSQGMTIDLLEMKLHNVFESGQAYVALSRVTSLNGLKLLSFDASKIFANQRVIKFYEELNVTNHSQVNNITTPKSKTTSATANTNVSQRNNCYNKKYAPRVNDNRIPKLNAQLPAQHQQLRQQQQLQQRQVQPHQLQQQQARQPQQLQQRQARQPQQVQQRQLQQPEQLLARPQQSQQPQVRQPNQSQQRQVQPQRQHHLQPYYNNNNINSNTINHYRNNHVQPCLPR